MTSDQRDAELRFRAFYAAHLEALLAYALRRVDQPADAADVVADTFLVAWRRRDALPPGDEARLWLYGVARKALANHRRGGRRRERLGMRLRERLAQLPVRDPAAEGTDRAAVHAAMRRLAIPLPPGFDRGSVGRGVALDPYQAGAEVTGAVACGWIREWERARSAGDEAAVRRAVGALSGSRGWKVLNDMNAEGDYPETIWGYADQVAAGEEPEGYRSGLGCD